MTETVVNLRWDGVYIPANQQEHKDGTRLWRNSKALGHCLSALPPNFGRKTVHVRPGTQPAEAAVIREQRAKVVIIETPASFAPGQEWMWIRASINHIHNVGSLVLQIRDANNTLVYTERLSQNQVLGLPRGNQPQNAPPPPLVYAVNEPGQNTKERAELEWANPTGSPYRVRILITRRRAGAADSIRGVPTLTEPAATSADHEANTVLNPGDDQTSVVVNSLSLDLVPWSELYQMSTGLTAATVPPAGPDRIKWVQYKLNDLGWFAGKIDGDANNPDLRKAIVRYRQSNNELYVETCKQDDYSGIFSPDPRGGRPSPDIDDNLLRELGAGRQPRSTSEPGVFTGTAGKIHLDADCFSRDADANDATSDFAKESAGATSTLKYDREQAWFSAPRFPLRAKVEVRDSGGNNVWSPGVSQSTNVQWRWQDELEDTNGLAGPPNATQRYIDIVKAAQPPVANFQNARTAVGGQISGNAATDVAVVFDGIDAVPPTPTATGVTTAGPLVFFRPSTIAGDRYELTATVGALHATTGMMTLWRRIHVVGHVSWGGPPSNVWPAVIANYASAYVEVVQPATPDTMANVANAALRTAFEAKAGRGAWSDAAWDSRAFSERDFTQTTPEDMAARIEEILDGNDQAYTRWTRGEDSDIDIGQRYKVALARLNFWRRGVDDGNGGVPLTTLRSDMNLQGGRNHYWEQLKRICEPSTTNVEPAPSETTATETKEPSFLDGLGKKTLPGPPKPALGIGGIGGGMAKKVQPMQFKNGIPAAQRKIVRWAGNTGAIEAALRERVNKDTSNLILNTQKPVLRELHEILGPGIAVLEFEPHQPVQIGAIQDYRAQNSSSMMVGAGKVVVNRACFGPYRPEHLFTHELAHALFLKHYKNAPEQVAEDHDLSDDNCVMSYIATGRNKGEISSTAAHYLPTNYNPKFCGKCNLKLRGWNIRAPGMPRKANDADPDPVVTQ